MKFSLKKIFYRFIEVRGYQDILYLQYATEITLPEIKFLGSMRSDLDQLTLHADRLKSAGTDLTGSEAKHNMSSA